MGIFRFKGKFEFLAMEYPCEIEIKGRIYSSAKRAFAAIRFNDDEMLDMCVKCDDKVLDYVIENSEKGPFIESDFSFRTLDYLDKIFRLKLQDEELREALIKTKGEKIIYLNKNTKLGIYQKEGDNLIGKSLMRIREEILKEDHYESETVPETIRVDDIFKGFPFCL